MRFGFVRKCIDWKHKNNDWRERRISQKQQGEGVVPCWDTGNRRRPTTIDLSVALGHELAHLLQLAGQPPLLTLGFALVGELLQRLLSLLQLLLGLIFLLL